MGRRKVKPIYLYIYFILEHNIAAHDYYLAYNCKTCIPAYRNHYLFTGFHVIWVRLQDDEALKQWR